MRGAVVEQEVAYFGVGRSATVLLVRDESGHLRLFTNGLPEAFILTRDGEPVRPGPSYWMGILPALLRPDARDLLVVGVGGGTVLESVPSSFHTIEAIEIEAKVLTANRVAAAERLRDPLGDPRLRLYTNDARSALALSGLRAQQ